MTGAALLGWGIGWALIAALTIRFTDQPQRWALVPAGSSAWPESEVVGSDTLNRGFRAAHSPQ